MLVVPQEPDLLERIAVVLGLPAHRLAPARRREVEFIPGQRMGPVVRVGPLRGAGVAVDGDADQVAGHGLGAGVPQASAHGQSVAAAVVLKT